MNDEKSDTVDDVSTKQTAGEQLQSQLASMCTSLLRNEQTLLSMLQNQNQSGNGGKFRDRNNSKKSL